jgi:hypothetical protein
MRKKCTARLILPGGTGPIPVNGGMSRSGGHSHTSSQLCLRICTLGPRAKKMSTRTAMAGKKYRDNSTSGRSHVLSTGQDVEILAKKSPPLLGGLRVWLKESFLQIILCRSYAKVNRRARFPVIFWLRGENQGSPVGSSIVYGHGPVPLQGARQSRPSGGTLSVFGVHVIASGLRRRHENVGRSSFPTLNWIRTVS